MQDGDAKKLEKAKITLNDCLACSGCITSAESVLITQQSLAEVYKVLDDKQKVHVYDVVNHVSLYIHLVLVMNPFCLL